MSNNSKQNQECELSLIWSGLPRGLYLCWAWGGQGCHERLVLKAKTENDLNIYNSEKWELLIDWLARLIQAFVFYTAKRDPSCIFGPSIN